MLVDKLEDIVEVVHVFSDHEGGVACLDFLVVLQGIAALLDLRPGPSRICQITQVVFGAHEHRYGNVALDIGVVDLGWSVLAILLLIDLLSPVVEFHVARVDHLSIVNQGLH